MGGLITVTPTNRIILEDNTEYLYSVNPFGLNNALGKTVAILEEYIFTKNEEAADQPVFKLYKTKEGNWYDLNEINTYNEPRILRQLKTAIDLIENGSL